MYASVLLYAFLPALVSAHGYLSSPPPRGIQKASYQVDDLKSPNRSGAVCRGEPAGEVTSVTSGGKLTLGLTITAPHVGPCEVHLLDYPSMQEISTFASKMDCAAPGKAAPWTIDLPQAQGRKVLRWTWMGCHVTPCEPYEQCIDVDFGRGGPSYGYAPPPPPPSSPPPPPSLYQSSPPPRTYTPPLPQYQPAPPQPSPTYGGSCVHGTMHCNGQGFVTCVYNTLVPQACAPGTQCKQNGDSILCA